MTHKQVSGHTPNLLSFDDPLSRPGLTFRLIVLLSEIGICMTAHLTLKSRVNEVIKPDPDLVTGTTRNLKRRQEHTKQHIVT